MVVAGSSHACAILGDGTLKCWGGNFYGALGLEQPAGDSGSLGTRGDGSDGGAMGDELPSVKLGTGRTAIDVTVGGDILTSTELSGARPFTCAVLDDYTLKCWGYNVYGELGRANAFTVGDGPNEMGDNLAPVPLGTGTSVRSVRAGTAHVCALLADGHVKCWGYNGYGNLGLGDLAGRGTAPGQMGDALSAVDLGNDAGASAIAAGAWHACALLVDGRVKCWGLNQYGELGIGDTVSHGGGAVDAGGMGTSLPAIDFGGGRTAKAIASGPMARHTCAILSDDSLVCWGFNSYGQLGQGDVAARGGSADASVSALAPVALGSGRHAASVAANLFGTCAVLDDGRLKCWGYGLHGALGSDDQQSRGNGPNQMGDNLPALIGVTGATAVSVGNLRACVVMGGRLKCFGFNPWGELGLGDTAPRGVQPGQMGGLPFVDLGTRSVP
jgi:alpha-tubulin suppressor-like RCC1 family protein